MPYEVKTIVIDAGHGGKDPGTIGATSKEKNIALNIALKVGGYLEKYLPDVKVIYTRKTDNFIELYDRPVIANKANADLFVSVHVDAIGGKSTVEGTTTYVMGLDKNKKNLDVAMRENSVMKYEENLENYNGFDPESDESYIIFDLYQSAFRENSLKLAEQIQTQFEKRVGRKSRGVKHGPFWVLWATTMPSVLVETGYITNPSEEQYLNTEKGQALIASGIFRAIRDYKNQVESIKVEN
ncbi:MAG: N-acetylmuramoyl-L-alanine amidase [Cyclobacteriaceae bacterium]|nr:N-acetylmuramoyl-L-alanine amidase [Cyclobacteriaceae bacterium]